MESSLPRRPFLVQLIKNQFLYGLLLGALFGLIANVASNYVQDKIERQRYYELLESEIFINRSDANTGLDSYNQKITQGVEYGDFSPSQSLFSTEVWKSGLEQGYIVQLEPEIQILLQTHYKYLEDTNNLFGVLNENSWSVFFKYLDAIGTAEETNAKALKDVIFEENAKSKADIDKKVGVVANSILAKFHPTKERLENPLLKIFMGEEVIPGLKGV